MKKSELFFILKAYFFWILVLLLIVFLAMKFIPLQTNFLGGGRENYQLNPFIWAWGNFDGEHYLSIAKNGYGYGEFAFFPLFPLILRMFGGNILSGIFVANAAFLAGLIGFYKLLRIDFSTKFSYLCVIFLLLFPTSFYFASVYTESLFFALAVWSIYFARRENWLIASLLGLALTATRFVGLIILPTLVLEWFSQNKNKKNSLSRFPSILLSIPVGLMSYMYFLDSKAHDMFAFFNNLALFGEQRSTHLITLPQVFYRYLFKIIPSLNTNFIPVIFTTWFEFSVGIIFLFASVWSFFKVRLSYATFLLLGYLIPTFSGSFSSIPRYVLVLFPFYIILTKLLRNRKIHLFAFSLISFILLVISFGLFARGYWVS